MISLVQDIAIGLRDTFYYLLCTVGLGGFVWWLIAGDWSSPRYGVKESR